MRILIMTDLEGVAGVIDYKNWCVSSGLHYKEAKELLSAELNAVASGFFDAGALEIVAIDGHGEGGIDLDKVDKRITVQRTVSNLGVFRIPPGRFDALAFVGQHAKASTDYGHISHTNCFEAIDFTINGVSIGEYGMMALGACEVNIPVIFAAGDEELCKEAIDFTPGTITVAVKKGTQKASSCKANIKESADSQLDAIHKPPRVVLELLYNRAKEAIGECKNNPQSFNCKKISPPFLVESIYRASGTLPFRKMVIPPMDNAIDAIQRFYREYEWLNPETKEMVFPKNYLELIS